jgi:hypothetical protein
MSADKLISIFNTVFIKFICKIKSDQYFKLVVKKYYRRVDKSSPLLLTYFYKRSADIRAKLAESAEYDLSSLPNVTIFKGIDLHRLLNTYKDDKEIIRYITYLSLISHYYTIISDNYHADKDDKSDSDSDSEEEADHESIIALKVLNGELSRDNLKELKDDWARSVITYYSEDETSASESFDTTTGIEEIDNIMNNSKLGKIAKDLAGKIDLENLNLDDLDIDDPMELLKNPGKLFGGKNAEVFGNIMRQVGGSITEMMQSGAINQEDLIADTKDIMSKVGGGDGNAMMQNIMGSMMGGGANGNAPNLQELQNLMNTVQDATKKIDKKRK